MADQDTAPSQSAPLAWTTIEACDDARAAQAVARVLLAAGVTIREIGPDDWREAGVEMPEEPWEVQIPSEAFDRALDALEAWDDETG